MGKASHAGPISPIAVEHLARRGIPLSTNEERQPIRMKLADLAGSELVIGVNEAEHRPILAELYPFWADMAEYWHIKDVDTAEPEEAMAILERQVRGLVEILLAAEEN